VSGRIRPLDANHGLVLSIDKLVLSSDLWGAIKLCGEGGVKKQSLCPWKFYVAETKLVLWRHSGECFAARWCVFTSRQALSLWKETRYEWHAAEVHHCVRRNCYKVDRALDVSPTQLLPIFSYNSSKTTRIRSSNWLLQDFTSL